MSVRLQAIQQRRAALVARAAAQRQDVDEIFAAWSGPIALADRMVDLFRRIRANPLLIPVGAALLILLKRRHKWPWVGRALTVWQVISSLRRLRSDHH